MACWPVEVEAQGREEVEGKVMGMALERWPREEWWEGHSVVVGEVRRGT